MNRKMFYAIIRVGELYDMKFLGVDLDPEKDINYDVKGLVKILTCPTTGKYGDITDAWDLLNRGEITPDEVQELLN